MTGAFICDIDGTVAHHGDRNIYDESRVLYDTPDLAVQTIVVHLVEAGMRPIFLTGRSENARSQTEAWLKKHLDVPVGTTLLMRKVGDRRPDFVVKKQVYKREIKPYHDVLFVLEDRARVVQMWRDIGLKCLHVAEGDY